MQQVGGLVDAGQQLPIAPAYGLVVRVGGAQEGQRGLVAESRSRIAEDLVGALHRQRFGQRARLQALHVGGAAHQERRRERARQGRDGIGLRHILASSVQACPSAM
ncbi:hypothetical protein G6F31_020504 [Rhizopus arrhizus]|nr:hypothetical protein G6F31_020504 [Rhizopus arrhizus]